MTANQEEIRMSCGAPDAAPAPFLHTEDTVRSRMLDCAVALMPALIWGVYSFGWRALTLVLLAVLACTLTEGLLLLLLHPAGRLSDLSAPVTGLLIGLNLPVASPLWLPVVGGAFAMLVKHLPAKYALLYLNPALAARALLLLAFRAQATRCTEPFAALPALAMSVEGSPAVSPLDALLSGGSVPASLTDLLLGNVPGLIGGVSAFALLLGGLYLLLRRTLKWQLPVGFLAAVALTAFLLPQSGDALLFLRDSLLSGSMLLGAFFLLADGGLPLTGSGRLVFGFGCGVLTMLCRRYLGMEGLPFAALVMNLLAPALDALLKPARFGGKAKKKSPPAR